MKKRIITLSVIFIALIFIYSTALGDENAQEKRRIEEDKRDVLKSSELKILEGEPRLLIDYGGWANYRYDYYDEDDNDSSIGDSLNYTNSLDTRLWFKATLRPPANAAYKNEHSYYLRLKNLYIQRSPEDQNDSYDNDGPHVDYSYFLFDIRPYWVELGRRYFSVGQGIAYSNVNDGIELYAAFTDWNLKTIISKTLPREDNVDTSVPGYDKESDRNYYGIEASYLGIPDHGIYGYFLAQRDYSNERPEEETANYTYDSEYYGLGLQGKLTANIRYWTEFIRQTGESYIYTTQEQKDVDAWAADLGISYDLDFYGKPNFTLEYAYGSGDSDRVSVTDTQDGNLAGDDTNFLYFGYLPSGYALSPRLSNLHFIKLGALFKPLQDLRLFKNLTFGIDYYRYYKDKKNGGISDADATNDNRYIGWELDLSFSWKIFSDLSWSMEYGYFSPGRAYPAATNDGETYFSSSITFTF